MSLWALLVVDALVGLLLLAGRWREATRQPVQDSFGPYPCWAGRRDE